MNRSSSWTAVVLAAALATTACDRSRARLTVWGDESTIGASVSIDGHAVGALLADSTVGRNAVLVRGGNPGDPEWRWPVEAHGDTLFGSGVPSARFSTLLGPGRHRIELRGADGMHLTGDFPVRGPATDFLASMRYHHLGSTDRR